MKERLKRAWVAWVLVGIVLSYFGLTQDWAYLAVLLSLILAVVFVRWRGYVSFIRDPGNVQALGPRLLEVDAEKVTVDQDGASYSTFLLKEAAGWAETANYFFIYLTSQSAYPVPKSALSVEQEQELRTILMASGVRLRKYGSL